MKKRRLKKRNLLLLLIIVLGVFAYFYYEKVYKVNQERIKLEEKRKLEEKKEKERLKKIKECIESKTEYNSSNYTEDLNTKIDEINTYLSNANNYALSYKELNEDFSIQKNEDTSFYGASIIKTALAIHIYEEAENDNSILDKEIRYNNSYYKGGSGIIKNNIKPSYTIRYLTKVMIEESDNIAFSMLYDNFNINDVRNYFKNLGTTRTFYGHDKYGYITANDCKIYMEELNRYFEKNTSLGNELKEFFNNASKNSIIKKSINKDMYFKYGETAPVYHEIVIVNDDNPYILVILTSKFPSSHESFISNLSLKIDDLHTTYYNSKNEYCNLKYKKS